MSVDARTLAARRILSDTPEGPPRFVSTALEALPRVRHGFFGREGGVSHAPYASLNCGPGSHDEAGRVADNRARVARTLGVESTHLLSAYQIHSPVCVRVDRPFTDDDRPKADALVTATAGLALGVLTADCAPVLLADADAGVIGAAHAGWKGAVGGVLQATIAAMESLGGVRARIVAAIGPCIRQPSYEVGPEFRTAALAAAPTSAAFFRAGRGDRLHFDLPGFCLDTLRADGIGRVEALPFDTASDAVAFFSYRRSVLLGEPDYGRQIAAITLEP